VLRANHRWTQTDVAHRMGMATYYRYWQIENDVRIPTFKERAKLARIFGVREWEIFPALVRKAA
jgi:transcriptional regulator with XRE-family HTH domain